MQALPSPWPLGRSRSPAKAQPARGSLWTRAAPWKPRSSWGQLLEVGTQYEEPRSPASLSPRSSLGTLLVLNSDAECGMPDSFRAALYCYLGFLFFYFYVLWY